MTRSIESIINQTDKDWKAIVLFDGVPPIDFNDERIWSIKVHKTGTIGKNHGNAGLVRNIGIDLAITDWVGFLDDDDTITENYVRTLKAYANTGMDLVVFRMDLNDRIVPALNNNGIVLNDVGISFAYRKALDHKFINSDAEDFIFLDGLIKKTNKWIVSNEVTYLVRR